jgi:hypothetical protein
MVNSRGAMGRANNRRAGAARKSASVPHDLGQVLQERAVGEWKTNTAKGTTPLHALPVDREYACVFPLTDSTGAATPRDCAGGFSDELNSYACDCGHLGLPASAVPSACGLANPSAAHVAGTPAGPIGSFPPANLGNDYTTQYYAKAYPTIRELTLAQLMGNQGVVSSLCPIHTTELGTNDPLYGYRPAATALINRLANQLSGKLP